MAGDARQFQSGLPMPGHQMAGQQFLDIQPGQLLPGQQSSPWSPGQQRTGEHQPPSSVPFDLPLSGQNLAGDQPNQLPRSAPAYKYWCRQCNVSEINGHFLISSKIQLVEKKKIDFNSAFTLPFKALIDFLYLYCMTILHQKLSNYCSPFIQLSI
jgi:hypothetical protein